MFTATLFTIAKIWKQPKSLYIFHYIYIMEYYSALKNEILPFATTWMDLEDIMLSEMSYKERQMPYDFTYMWNLKKTKQT